VPPGGSPAAERGKIAIVRALALLIAAFALVLAVAACGGGTNEDTAPENVEGTAATETEGEGGGGGGAAQGDPEAGKEVFASAGCGNCHTFEPAGASGTTAPNLDESNIDFEGAVEQIENGGGGMPPFRDQLSEEEIANVAAFVTSR
jgi:mono/diheme cytochrome c family protein